MVLVELVTVVNGAFRDYLAIYSSNEVDVSSPSPVRETRTLFDSDRSIGVFEIPGDNKHYSEALFADIFQIALKSGINGVSNFYDNHPS